VNPSPLSKLVFASSNPGKIREVSEIFRDSNISVIPQGEYGIESPEETGSTFADNALIKARHAASSSGLPAMADDSGRRRGSDGRTERRQITRGNGRRSGWATRRRLSLCGRAGLS
jgi:hypothetical protein